jgi:hypothetical protein
MSAVHSSSACNNITHHVCLCVHCAFKQRALEMSMSEEPPAAAPTPATAPATASTTTAAAAASAATGGEFLDPRYAHKFVLL